MSNRNIKKKKPQRKFSFYLKSVLIILCILLYYNSEILIFPFSKETKGYVEHLYYSHDQTYYNDVSVKTHIEYSYQINGQTYKKCQFYECSDIKVSDTIVVLYNVYLPSFSMISRPKEEL